MEEVPEAAVLHVVVEEEVAEGGERVSLEADEVAVLDAADGLQLGLELLEALRVVRVEPLDGDRLAVLQDALVHRARRAVPDYVLLAQVLGHPHDVLVHVQRHVHVEDHQLRRRVAGW